MGTTTSAPTVYYPPPPPPSYVPPPPPTRNPTRNPTPIPTTPAPVTPTPPPSNWPTSQPSENPSVSVEPSSLPSEAPSSSGVPSLIPSEAPSLSDVPSSIPSQSSSISVNPSFTGLPTSVPSDQPSIVEVTASVTGNFNFVPNMCTVDYEDAEELAAMCSGVQQTVQDLICSTDDCEVEFVCCGTSSTDQQDQSLPSSRKLQETTWQFEYTITDTFTCEISSCDSPADTAAIDSIFESVADPVSLALKDGTFASILATNVDINTLGVSPTCLVIWGAVQAPETEVNGGSNNDSTSGEGGSLFYPDWKYDSGTCLKDGEEPGYMRINPTEWLCNTLEECCERYYSGYNKNKCMNEQGSGLWYVDHLNERCVVDCDESNGPLCGGIAIATPLSSNLYADPKSCCEDQLGWIQSDFCEAESLRSTCYCGTKKWYQGDSVCVQDCDESCGGSTCSGIVTDASVVLSDSPEECCKKHYEWIEYDLCVARSTKSQINKYYPDLLQGKCANDSETPDN